jgi:hypothetical protein
MHAPAVTQHDNTGGISGDAASSRLHGSIFENGLPARIPILILDKMTSLRITTI